MSLLIALLSCTKSKTSYPAPESRYGPELAGLTFEFHTGIEYRQHLMPLLDRAGATCTCPVAGLQIGQRLSFYSKRHVPLPDDGNWLRRHRRFSKEGLAR